MEAVIFIGAPASGKSSFFRERFFRTHVRVNLDMLKTRHRERRLVQICLETGQPFVVDNTNPARADRARYLLPARAAGFRVVGYYFQSKVAELVRRNAERAVEESIPEQGVRGIHASLELPSRTEGFDTLFYVSVDPTEGFRVQEWNDEV